MKASYLDGATETRGLDCYGKRAGPLISAREMAFSFLDVMAQNDA